LIALIALIPLIPNSQGPSGRQCPGAEQRLGAAFRPALRGVRRERAERGAEDAAERLNEQLGVGGCWWKNL